ncbi:MAG TPA: energy transducer TonB [Candidatus Omnitrophota bacterium]|nr:energy transducer TonB [Candidatus Omnitrophota bacterium]HPT39314.1 energy transducer TonB [Candidatus Omnitrophota bacterium]
MITDHLLGLTLAISIFIHAGVLLQSTGFNPFVPTPKLQKIAVRYIKKNPQVQSLPRRVIDPGRERLMPKTEPFLKLDAEMGAGLRRAPLPYIEPADTASASAVSTKALLNEALPNKSVEFSKPVFASSEIMAIKKKITLPAIEMAKINNPSYISYYQIVREKIRRSAYQNYTHNVTGEVYVSFIISNEGYIKDVRLVEEKTTVNDYLKNIALRSVRDASPFPNFPKELDYPQLSFNIIISFEIE